MPGDIIIFRAGDKISADGRILEAHELEIDEASLTGESAPVDKVAEMPSHTSASQSKKDMVYMGTSVVKGRGMAVISSTGVNPTKIIFEENP